MAALGFEPRNTYVLSVYITNIFMIKYISLPKANGLTTIPHSPENFINIRYIYSFELPEQKKISIYRLFMRSASFFFDVD